MRIRLLTVMAVLLAAAIFTAACGGTSPSTVTSVTVTGQSPAVAATSQLTATAAYSDGSTKNVTTSSTWQSSNTTFLTVSSAGVVTGLAAGSSTVTATYQGMSGTLLLTVH